MTAVITCFTGMTELSYVLTQGLYSMYKTGTTSSQTKF